MKNRMKVFILILLICTSVSGCSIGVGYSRSVAKISGSSSSWTGEKRKEIEFEKGQTVMFRYRSKVDRGELSIQLLDPQGEVIHVFETNKKANIQKEIVDEGTYIILVSGTEFKGTYQVEW
jgi:hypothetical protein